MPKYEISPNVADQLMAIGTLSESLLQGGQPMFAMSTVINAQKCLTLPFCLLLAFAYGNWSTDVVRQCKSFCRPCCSHLTHHHTQMIYTAMHGSYGLLWYLKHLAFPDPSWSQGISLQGAVLAWTMVLGPYWLMPYLLIASRNVSPASPMLLGTCVLLYALGVSVMLVADAQKYFVLKTRTEKGLIQNGMFALVRSPNYLGEIMLYSAFALLVRHWLPWVHLLIVWTTLFLVRLRKPLRSPPPPLPLNCNSRIPKKPNIIRKERSMRRYPQWNLYAANTYMLVPYLL